MTVSFGEPIRLRKIATWLIPLLAGWSLGFFLREVQAAVQPYDTFFVISALAGQLQPIPAAAVVYGSQLIVLLTWLGSGWLLRRKSGTGWAQALEHLAPTYTPLVTLPVMILLAQLDRLWLLRYLLDPWLAAALGFVGAWHAWRWTQFRPPIESVEPRRVRWLLAALFAVGTLMFAVPGVLQFRAWNVAHWDTGTMEEMLWHTMHGRIMYSASYEPSWFGWHINLTQLLWLPVYALRPSIEWATVLQSLALAAGVFPVWWLARQGWGDRRALWLPLVYLMQPSLHFAAAGLYLNTYRPEAFLVPLVLYAVWAMEMKRWPLAALFGTLTMLCREDMGMLVALAGVYLALRHRLRLAGALICVAGIGYFLLCTQVIMPRFHPSGGYGHVPIFEGLGDSIGEIIRNLVLHPSLWLGRLWHVNNLFYLCCLLMPLGWLALGRPLLSLVAAAIILPGMLATYANRASIFMQYHNAPFAVLMAAAIGGGVIVAAALAKRFGVTPARAQCAVLSFLVASAATSSLIASKSPLSINFWWPPGNPFHVASLYTRTPHTALLDEMKRTIPGDARVCASFFAATHFTHHKAVFLYPERVSEADYVLVDLNSRFTPEIDESDARRSIQKDSLRFHREGIEGFDLLRAEDGIYLFRRRSP
jgi:uncharacterized membrane protein